MNIHVQRSDGNTEILDLAAGIAMLKAGDRMDALELHDGRVHYFTKDGLYDGWAQQLSGAMPLNAMADIVTAIERSRLVYNAAGDRVPIEAPMNPVEWMRLP